MTDSVKPNALIRRFPLLALAFFGAAPPAFAEGGSHIGNFVRITNGLRAVVPREANLSEKDGMIYDEDRKEPVLKIRPIDRGTFLGRRDVVGTTLGAVSGYELLLTRFDRQPTNRWMVCGERKDEECVEIVPASPDNPLVSTLIGTLGRTKP